MNGKLDIELQQLNHRYTSDATIYLTNEQI